MRPTITAIFTKKAMMPMTLLSTQKAMMAPTTPTATMEAPCANDTGFFPL